MVVERITKPKTKRGKRFLEERDPKVHENIKKAMFVKGGKTSNTVTTALKQFYMLKKPNSTHLVKKNIMRPFDDPTPMEYLSQKNDHSLFMFGCDSKKRPDNLIMGRMFDHHVLDMFEFGIERLVQMEKFAGPKVTLGIKPCLVFQGELFDTQQEYQRLKCLLIDFFRGEVVDNIRLQGLEHVWCFTAVENKVHIRSYRINYIKSDTKVPNVELNEIGPSIDLVVRRHKIASDSLYKTARKQPKEIIKKKKKNISMDPFGNRLGRIHMEKQDLSKLQTRKRKGLKRRNDPVVEGEENSEAKKVKNSDDVKNGSADE